MKELLKEYWYVATVVVILLALGAWVVLRPVPAPPLSPAAEKNVRAAITNNQERAGRDTARAQAAAASGATNYEAGKAYATVATTIHQQAQPHATPTPSGDSAAKRLQRVLSGY